MLASLVSVALALVGASRTLDESYYCNKLHVRGRSCRQLRRRWLREVARDSRVGDIKGYPELRQWISSPQRPVRPRQSKTRSVV